jgi:hypothetical protein
MQLDRKLACVRENAGLRAFERLIPARRRRTAVAKDAFRILAPTTVLTRRHTGDKAEGSNLAAVRLISVLVSTLHAVRTFLSQKVDVA